MRRLPAAVEDLVGYTLFGMQIIPAAPPLPFPCTVHVHYLVTHVGRAWKEKAWLESDFFVDQGKHPQVVVFLG